VLHIVVCTEISGAQLRQPLLLRGDLGAFGRAKRKVIDMDANSSLTVRVGRSGSKYIWQLHRDGIVEKVKYSGPIYISEQSAMVAGQAARTIYLSRLAHQKQR
jgi:hypothetical protein